MDGINRVRRGRTQIEALLDELQVPDHERPYYIKDELEGDDPALPGLVLEREIKQVLIGRSDVEWVEQTIEQLEQLEEGGQVALFCGTDPRLLDALRIYRQSGLPMDMLATIVNAAQENLLNTVVRLLEDGRSNEGFDGVYWGLFEVDENGRPGRRMESLSRFLSQPLPDE